MNLVGEKAYRDFVLRLEFLRSSGMNGGVLLRSPPGLAKNDIEIDLDGPEGSDLMGALRWDYGDGNSGKRSPGVIPVAVKPAGSWNLLEVELIDGRLSFAINGRQVYHYADFSDCTGPHRVGFQAQRGDLRVRNAEVLEVDAKVKAGRPPRLIFSEGFDDHPWKEADEGVENGVRYLVRPKPGYRIQALARYGPPELTCEAVGRSVVQSAGGRGSWGLVFLAKDRGFQVLINGRGELFVQPSYWAVGKDPEEPRIGPIAHPAIRPGDQFNALHVTVQKHQVDIRVNDARVCDPIVYGWALDLHKVQMGAFSEAGVVRAEFDRVEARELDPKARPARAPGWPTSPPPGRPSGTPDRLLYADTFNDPNSEWARGPCKMGQRDYANGVYFYSAQKGWSGTWTSGDATDPIARDFQVEVDGRVLGDGPNAAGGWGIIIGREVGPGLDIQIDRQGRLAVVPSSWGGAEFMKKGERLGPIAHPDIRPGDQYNKLTVRAHNRRVEILVNGTRVCDPIDLGWDMLPGVPNLILSKPSANTRIRAEYDRIEIRSLAP